MMCDSRRRSRGKTPPPATARRRRAACACVPYSSLGAEALRAKAACTTERTDWIAAHGGHGTYPRGHNSNGVARILAQRDGKRRENALTLPVKYSTSPRAIHAPIPADREPARR